MCSSNRREDSREINRARKEKIVTIKFKHKIQIRKYFKD